MFDLMRILSFFVLCCFLFSCGLRKHAKQEAWSFAKGEKPALQGGYPEVRPEGCPGYLPPAGPFVELDGASFPKSMYGDSMGVLDFPEGKPPHTLAEVRIINQKAFSSWEEAGINDERFRYFLIEPGDYRGWGPLVLKRSGALHAPRILRYYDPRVRDSYRPPHPVRLADGDGREVLLESFEFFGADYWVLHGLTFRGKASRKRGLQGGLTSKMKPGSDHNIIDYCLFERFLGIAALRILQSNDNLIQRCVFRNKTEGMGVDMGGIVISARAGGEARGNRIVDNEFYNLTDAVGLQYNVPRKGNRESNAQTGSVPATVIENNDIYLEPRLYREKEDGEWACAEDGLDIKVGSKSNKPEDRILVLGNRIWGFRPTDQSCGGSGSTGVGILLHRQASNILIKDNIIFNTAQGIVVFGENPKKPGEKVENITIENNLICDMRRAVDREQMGLAMRLVAPCTLRYNTVCKAEELFFFHVRQSEHVLRHNLFKDIKRASGFQMPSGLVAEANLWVNVPEKAIVHRGVCADRVLSQEEALAWRDYGFFCRRWTGPQFVHLKAVLPAVDHLQDFLLPCP